LSLPLYGNFKPYQMISLRKPVAMAVIACLLITCFSACSKKEENKGILIDNDMDDPASSDASLKLVWSEEFNATTIDASKWNFEVNGDGGGNGEAQYYTDRSSNAAIKDGNLVITAVKESYQGKSYTSARLTTAKKGEFKYGRIEARAKLPKGRGMWPAIWLLSNTVPLNWPHTGELDIMEAVGYRPDTVFSTIHSTSSGYGNWLPVPNSSTVYHTYSADWTADTVKFFVDKTLVSSYANEHLPDATAAANQWPFDHPFFIILNVAVGGAWGGIQGIDDTIFPQSMSVDWVRVYQKK
jgi:beta-glucanase (GH16 family)